MKLKLKVLAIITIATGLNLNAQWTTVDAGNAPETTLFKHTGSNTPVPFNIQKHGYSGTSVNYGILHLDMAHSVIGGGANLHFRLKNTSGSFKEYGGFGSFILDNTTGSEDGGLTFYTTFNGTYRTRRMTILNNGYTGIGITNPTERLDLDGNLKITGDLKMSGSDSYIWTNGTGTGYTGIWDQKNSRVLLYTTETTGRVGIGTISPTEKLTVEGNVSAKDFISGGSNSWIFHTPDDGRKNLYIAPQKPDNSGWDWSKYLFIQHDGSVGIGGATDLQGFKLGIKGKMAAQEIKVATYPNWSDFVFESDYKLPTLKEIEKHIKEKGHLKDIPSAKEVKENGFFLGQMDARLLQKIEELTLYTIEQDKSLKNQNLKIESQQKEIEELKKQNTVLKSLLERVRKLEKEIKTK